jgi:hypothetical protein
LQRDRRAQLQDCKVLGLRHGHATHMLMLAFRTESPLAVRIASRTTQERPAKNARHKST